MSCCFHYCNFWPTDNITSIVNFLNKFNLPSSSGSLATAIKMKSKGNTRTATILWFYYLKIIILIKSVHFYDILLYIICGLESTTAINTSTFYVRAFAMLLLLHYMTTYGVTLKFRHSSNTKLKWDDTHTHTLAHTYIHIYAVYALLHTYKHTCVPWWDYHLFYLFKVNFLLQ